MCMLRFWSAFGVQHASNFNHAVYLADVFLNEIHLHNFLDSGSFVRKLNGWKCLGGSSS